MRGKLFGYQGVAADRKLAARKIQGARFRGLRIQIRKPRFTPPGLLLSLTCATKRGYYPHGAAPGWEAALPSLHVPATRKTTRAFPVGSKARTSLEAVRCFPIMKTPARRFPPDRPQPPLQRRRNKPLM